MTAGADIGLTVYGLGDDSHWLGCGDHISKPCSGHAGWITAFDVMAKTGVFDPVDCATKFLLPILKADASFYPWFKYMLTDMHLWDRRAPHNLQMQDGGDDAGHLHISCTNSMGLRCTFIQDYQAWKKAGRPPVVAWFRNKGQAAVEVESHMNTLTLADDKTTVTFAIDVLGHPVISYNDGDDWTVINTAVKFAGGISVDSFDGDYLVASCALASTREIYMLHIPTPKTPSAGYRAQPMGGQAGDTPCITVKPDRTIMLMTRGNRDVKGADGKVIPAGRPWRKYVMKDGRVKDWAPVKQGLVA
jgi:hypothetical protein